MSTEIKAIPTEYNGVMFRSRLEARWAMFFDALGIRWLYEHEGYDLDGEWYVPDFWLPDLDVFIEIKGAHPSDEALDLCSRLGELAQKRIYLFYGPVADWVSNGGLSDSGLMFSPWGGDTQHWFCIRECCGKVGIKYNGRSERITCPCINRDQIEAKEYTSDHRLIVDAADRANKYSFWSPARRSL